MIFRSSPRKTLTRSARSWRSFDFNVPLGPVEALRFAADGLSRYSVNFRSRRYFGLFEPAPATMGVVGEALAAAFNPQLAAWLASPFAIEAERSILRALGVRFGFAQDEADGTFTSGGAEANHTAVLTALTRRFQKWQKVVFAPRERSPSSISPRRDTPRCSRPRALRASARQRSGAYRSTRACGSTSRTCGGYRARSLRGICAVLSCGDGWNDGCWSDRSTRRRRRDRRRGEPLVSRRCSVGWRGGARTRAPNAVHRNRARGLDHA